jgi:hypothetical protein
LKTLPTPGAAEGPARAEFYLASIWWDSRSPGKPGPARGEKPAGWPTGQPAFSHPRRAPKPHFKAVGGSSNMLWMAIGERLELATEPI